MGGSLGLQQGQVCFLPELGVCSETFYRPQGRKLVRFLRGLPFQKRYTRPSNLAPASAPLRFKAGAAQYVAVGQNQWYHFGVGAPLILVNFGGDWDVHWGYDLAVDPWPC